MWRQQGREEWLIFKHVPTHRNTSACISFTRSKRVWRVVFLMETYIQQNAQRSFDKCAHSCHQGSSKTEHFHLTRKFPHAREWLVWPGRSRKVSLRRKLKEGSWPGVLGWVRALHVGEEDEQMHWPAFQRRL